MPGFTVGPTPPGISGVIAAYDPGRIIMDGSVVFENWDLFCRYTFFYVRLIPGYLPEILKSPLNGDAPLPGAASAVLHPGMDVL